MSDLKKSLKFQIGIMGGTFDPVHLGHIIVAEECKDRLGLDWIECIPAKLPPHKTDLTISIAQHRLQMIQLALGDWPDIRINPIELNRKGPSFTIDTLKQLSHLGDLHLLMGMDSFLALDTWAEYTKFLDYARCVVTNRPGLQTNDQAYREQKIINLLDARVMDLRENCEQPDNCEWNVCFLSIPGIQISASEIRERVKQNRSIRHLVPLSVVEYIKRNNLYV